MKKSFLALAVAALTAVTAASTASATTVYDKDGTSLGIYGRIQGVWYSDKTGHVSNEESTVDATGRLGLDLRSQINPYVAGFALAEWEVANGNNKPDESDGFDARYMWVGADFGQFGQLKIGKFEEAIKYAISQTDIFDDWGCTGLAGNDDRREGVVQYSWSGYGVDVMASYAFAKDNEHLDGAYFAKTAENVDLKGSWSVAAGYTSPDVLFGPIAIRAGYLGGNFADGKENTNNVTRFGYYDSYSQYAVGLSWGKLNLGPYVAVEYQQRSFDMGALAAGQTNHDYDVSGWEVVAGYSFANGISIRTGYETQNIEVDGLDVDVTASTIPVYLNWQLNPQINIWAEARFDANTDDDEDQAHENENFDLISNTTNYAENVFSVGMRYSF